MKLLATLINIAEPFLNLIEMEGNLLKKRVMKLGWALAFVAVSTLMIIVAAGFFLLGIYQYLATQISPAATSIFVSLLAIILALIFACLSKWRAE